MKKIIKNNIKDVLMEIKKSPFIRILAYPVGAAKRKRAREIYLNTGEPEKIRYYKNIHRNERCFIIGNGPSLLPEDLNLLTDEVTFATNRIYALFDKTIWRPTYYVSVDRDVIFKEVENIAKLDCKEKFIDMSAMKLNILSNCVFICSCPFFMVSIYGYKKSFVKEDVSEYFSNGGTVTFTMIQLAIYMGFKEIYLLGQDFSMPYYKDKFGFSHKTEEANAHFVNGSVFKRTYLNRDSSLYAFQQAKRYCNNNGIIIKNLTRGGKLEVFERDYLETVLKQ